MRSCHFVSGPKRGKAGQTSAGASEAGKSIDFSYISLKLHQKSITKLMKVSSTLSLYSFMMIFDDGRFARDAERVYDPKQERSEPLDSSI